MTFRPTHRTIIHASAFFCFLFLTSGLFAQAVAVAEVDGIVSDPSAKFIVGAQVTLTGAETKAAHDTVTDSEGRYHITNLPPGPYVLDVKSPGFKDYRQSGIVLEVAHTY